MRMANVVGTVTLNRCHPSFQGARLKLVIPKSLANLTGSSRQEHDTLVAWDERGGRLGMGAGYYDRALEHVAVLDQPLRIGIAYGVQQADELPMTPTDVRLHAVLTESGLFTCTA